MVLLITLLMDSLYLNNLQVRQHPQYQGCEAKWNSAIFNLIIYFYTSPAVTCEDGINGKGRFIVITKISCRNPFKKAETEIKAMSTCIGLQIILKNDFFC